MTSDVKEWYTVTEAARYLGFEGSTIRRHCEKGYLPAKKLSNGFIIHIKHLQAFIPPPRGKPK